MGLCTFAHPRSLAQGDCSDLQRSAILKGMDQLGPDGFQGLLSGGTWWIAALAAALPALMGVGVGGCGSADSVMDPGAAGSDGATSASSGGQGGSGATGSGNGAATGASTGAGGAPEAWCEPIPACELPPPAPGPAAAWRHDFESPIIVLAGDPNHRGRDLFLNPGDPQWIIGKFSYGLIDKDLEDEDVDIYLLRDCAGSWEKLGTATTTRDNQHPTVEGVDDSGGRVYFRVPEDKALGVGRHRVHLVVKGDLSTTDLFIQVVPPKTPVFVSDVDGTLTTTETEEFQKLLTGELPGVHADAANAFKLLVKKGYHPLYLTARPEWLVARTREFLKTYGFPPGIVHTTLSLTGALGGSAATYKSTELEQLAGKGMIASFGFGNTASDADAYEKSSMLPIHARFYYQFDDTEHGGRRIESYTELIELIEALPSLCP
jgi:hypothetical protein